MDQPNFPERSDALHRGQQAEILLAELFKRAGWRVDHPQSGRESHRPDLIVHRRQVSYAVEIKAGAEGRSDRLIPLWAQACLQASRVAGRHAPLAVVAAPQVSLSVAEQILKFAEDYAPEAAAGVIDFAHLRLFRGPELEELNVHESDLSLLAHQFRASRASSGWNKPREQVHLFSDLNQWMLKVLLAPEIPDELLSARRGQYRNASQLAKAANVSVMSAFRLVLQLQRDGYLHESEPHLKLVRREDLFHRWQAVALRKAREMPMRFLLRADPRAELHRMLQSGRACLALFAAADALHMGFVQGVPPYVYVERLQPANVAAWKNLVPAGPGEAPDVILRQAPAPQSVFRGMVRSNGLASCDIIQVWLDVSAHPSRGQEQAELIGRRVLDPLIHGAQGGG